MKLKDLKITYNTLCELDSPVPKELLVSIAERVRDMETRALERKKARMTEEQLIHLSEKQKRVLRIYLPDGRMVQKPTSQAAYRAAVREIEPERMAALRLSWRRKELIRYDASLARRRYTHYYFLKPGYFVLDPSTTAERFAILQSLDKALHLNWDIELV